jgi:hypothetical protein
MAERAMSGRLAERDRLFEILVQGNRDVLLRLSELGVDTQDCFQVLRSWLADVTRRRHRVLQG